MVATGRLDGDLLGLEEVTKVFPNGTVALRGVDLHTAAGTIHGLVGANGAGKSTLIKIMSGAIAPTSGTLHWRGAEVRWVRPGESLRAGIATVHQHSPLVPTLSVLENVFLGARGHRMWRAGARRAELARLFETIGYELPTDELVGDLAIGDRQMVAILQAISQSPSLLILDEPTASLSASERDLVHRTIGRLSEQGTGVVFVSHLLDEIMEVTTAVTVLRDGRVTLDDTTAAVSQDTLVEAIVGRKLLSFERRAHTNGQKAGGTDTPVLDVRDLRSPGRVAGISLSVAPGEVVGLAGLLGSGRSEILHAIYGSDSEASGSVRIAGSSVRRSPVAAVRAGIALVPEDRGEQGLVPGWEIWRNISLPVITYLSRWRTFPRRDEELARARAAVADLGIQPPSPYALVDELSGGNAQKTVFAKWLHDKVRVLLLDEPTAGIDVSAKLDIQLLIRRLTERGVGVLLVDSDFDELLAACDRVLVVRRGQVVAERSSARTTETDLLALASGLGENKEQPIR